MTITRHDVLRMMLAGTAFFPGAAFAQSAASETANGMLAPWSGATEIGPKPLTFTVVGDNTALARPGVFDQTMTQVSWLQPDFVMSIGDVIEGYAEDAETVARRWMEAEQSIAKLGCPFLVCGGNHDLSNPVYAEAWTQRFGRPWRSFEYKNALFLILCTEDPVIPLTSKASATFNAMVDLVATDFDRAQQELGAFLALPEIVASRDLTNQVNISDEQVGWAVDTLAQNRDAQWTFVFLHKPAWKSEDRQFMKIQAALGDRPHTVFGGHTHYATHEVIAGRDYVNLGTSGGIRTRPGPGNLDHVINVTLTTKGPVYANLRLTGLLDLAGQSGQTLAY